MNTFQIFYAPMRIFNAISADNYKWRFALLTLVILTVIEVVFNIPIQHSLLDNSEILTKLSPVQREMVYSMQSKMTYISIFTQTIFFIIKILFLALLLWGGVSFISKDVKYKQVLSLLLATFFIIVFGDLINLGIVFFKGVNHITTAYDLYKVGLNIFFDPKKLGVVLYTGLYYINPFQIWFYILTIIGLKRITSIQLSKAVVITTIIWLIMIIVPIVSAYFGEITQSKVGTL